MARRCARGDLQGPHPCARCRTMHLRHLTLGGHQVAGPLYSGPANPLTSRFCLRDAIHYAPGPGPGPVPGPGPGRGRGPSLGLGRGRGHAIGIVTSICTIQDIALATAIITIICSSIVIAIIIIIVAIIIIHGP